MAPTPEPRHPSPPPSLRELAATFLRISLLGFGGPNAHLALMLDEVVDRKHWITREHFLHLVGITNLLPGPNSSEVAIHLGYTQRGWRGALVAGLAFLSPTFILVVGLSVLYFRFGALPRVEGVFWGLKPAVLAIILAAGWKLAKVALSAPAPPTGKPAGPGEGRDEEAVGADTAEGGRIGRSGVFTRLLLLALALGGGAVSLLLDRWEVAAMAVGGVVAWIVLGRSAVEPGGGGSTSPPRTHPGILALPSMASLLPALSTPLGQLFGLMLGSGAVLFGGGYMLVALLEPYVVEAYGWLTPQQFLDGIALTQAVPGPIVTLVAFVGYGVAGVPGAAVATAGIYIPSFAAVLLVAPALERWRRVEGFRAALKGVNAVVAGAILGVGLTLIPPAVSDRWGAMILMVALIALIRFRARAIWVVAGGLAAGILHVLLAG